MQSILLLRPRWLSKQNQINKKLLNRISKLAWKFAGAQVGENEKRVGERETAMVIAKVTVEAATEVTTKIATELATELATKITPNRAVGQCP